jgi:hypothetical protein
MKTNKIHDRQQFNLEQQSKQLKQQILVSFIIVVISI